MSQHLAVELLSSYVDEEVTPAQLRLVEDHLSACTECRRTLSGLRAVAASVRRLETVAPPPTLSAAVERRVRLATLEKPRGFGFEEGLRRWLGQPVLAPAFAVVLALGAILYLFALGVSERGQTTTRVVVASVPDEEDKGSSEERRRFEADFEASAPEMISTGRSSEPARPGAAELPRTVGSKTVAAAEPTSPASDTPEGAATERRDVLLRKLSAKLEEVEAETAPTEQALLADAVRASEQDSQIGVGRRTAARQRTAVPAEPTIRAMTEESFTNEAPETRDIAGRQFVKEAGVWVEIGLEGLTAPELVDLRLASAALDAEWAAFRDLGRVRLRVDDRIVEVIYPAAEAQE